MPPTLLTLIAIFTVALIAVFLYASFRGVETSPRGVRPLHGLIAIQEHPAPLPVAPTRPMKILLAVDGSPCSDRAIQAVVARPWPRGSHIEVLTVVSTRMPEWPDGLLMLEAARVEALEAERVKAPLRLARAEQALARVPDVTVRTRTVEATPADAILQEAESLGADLVVLGSHGYGPVTQLALGSVSETVAHKAHCSVEIVRCPGHALPGADALASTSAQPPMDRVH